MPRAAGNIHPHFLPFLLSTFSATFSGFLLSQVCRTGLTSQLRSPRFPHSPDSEALPGAVVRQGDALYVPSFWHHAVYSPPGTLSDDCRNVGINYWYIAQHTREEAMEKMHSMEGKEDL